MKKKFTLIIIFFIITFALFNINKGLTKNNLPEVKISGPSDVVKLIDNIAKWFYNIILALGVIFVLIAAFYYLTGGGNPQTIQKANKQLFYAVIAVIVAIAAFSIKTIIVTLLTK